MSEDLNILQRVKGIIETKLKNMRVINCSAEMVIEDKIKLDSTCLLVMDLDLPGQNSLELLDQIKHKTDAPIVILDDPIHGVGRMKKALQIGASDYLFKPIHNSYLIATIIAHSEGGKYAV